MGFLQKIFGGGKTVQKSGPEQTIRDTVQGILDRAQLSLSFDVKTEPSDNDFTNLLVDFFGEDEDLLKEKEGQLLDSFQLILTRVIQHAHEEEKINIQCDCTGFREDAVVQLRELADRLRDVALEKGKPVYFRALPPKDRKVIHQYLAEDERVKSRSIGEGHFKKIKIFPAKV